MTQPIPFPEITALVIAGALSVCLTPALHAQSATSMKRVSLDSGHVSFSVPADFHALSLAQIRLKFPSSHPPQLAYANQTESISIAVTLTGKVPDLPTMKHLFDQMLPQRVPGFHWIKEGYSTLNHTSWLDMEFTSAAVDTTIHNEELLALLPDKAAIVNLNATIKSYPKAAPAFQAIKRSLSISP